MKIIIIWNAKLPTIGTIASGRKLASTNIEAKKFIKQLKAKFTYVECSKYKKAWKQ